MQPEQTFVVDNWEDLYPEEIRPETAPQCSLNSTDRSNSRNICPDISAATSDDTTEDSVGDPELRCPIVCVLGHVDSGKTSLLDRIRSTKVQKGEAGGITQQIGATFVPVSLIQQFLEIFDSSGRKLSVRVPGLLFIDTPGHETFSNLRNRGSSLCDIAILVVSSTDGLDRQTLEPHISLLREHKIPFVIALNKLDRCYEWEPHSKLPVQEAIKKQKKFVQGEFETKWKQAVCALAENQVNSVLHYRNKDHKKTVNIVPVSAKTGDGIGDLLMLIIQLTQNLMKQKLQKTDTLESAIMDVKMIKGLGSSMDVILVNGTLRVGDDVILATLDGPVTCTIRSLLTPKPMAETRVKGGVYDSHKEVSGVIGVRVVTRQDVTRALPGTSIVPFKKGEEIAKVSKAVMDPLNKLFAELDKKGISVQASTLGSLEAFVAHLKSSGIPICHVNVGPVNKKDIIKAATMLEHGREFGVLLAFNVEITPEAKEAAKELKVEIIQGDIIYQLHNNYVQLKQQFTQQKRQELQDVYCMPCILEISNAFKKSYPLLLGITVVDGQLLSATTLSAMDPTGTQVIGCLGRISSIQMNHNPVQSVPKGATAAIKVDELPTNKKLQFGRHFDEKNPLCSTLNVSQADLLLRTFPEDFTQDEKKLMLKLAHMH